jgi:hypothetical protein
MIRLLRIPAILGIVSALHAFPAGAQSEEAREPISAPYAQMLVRAEMSQHPGLTFIGLHATPPGGKHNLIVACSNLEKIGLVSTQEDMIYAQTGRAKAFPKPQKHDFEVDLWFGDHENRTLGMIVLHMKDSTVTDQAGALKQASVIQKELQKRIANHDQLFGPESSAAAAQ